MSKRYCAFDVGHGGVDSGAVNGARYEKNDVLRLATSVENYIETVTGGQVDCQKSRTTDKYLSLEERCKWQKRHPEYEFFVSFHRDSWKTSEPHGSHVIVYTNGSKKSMELANCIAKRLNVIFKGRSNGITKENLYVLHHTSCPACLIECGFITSEKDNRIFDTRYNEIVEAISEGIIEYAKFKKVKQDNTDNNNNDNEKDVLYRVVTNTFANKENALNEQKRLKEKGIDSFLVTVNK